MVKVAIIDPSSYSLPYDYFFILELQKYYQVDFYFSKTESNYEYIEKLKNCENVTLFEYYVSPSSTNKFRGLFSYSKMLIDIFSKRKSYIKIHFLWSIFFLIEVLLFVLIREKLVFTFHNAVPHSYKRHVFPPYRFINKLASKIVFVSNYTMRTFFKYYGMHSNAHLFQHGLLPIKSLPDIQTAKDKDLEKAILFWGRVEEYKGVDIFANLTFDYPVEICGRWCQYLEPLKNKLSEMENVVVDDRYLVLGELEIMLSREVIFILPYKNGSQSGILYTLLAYGKVFISSNVGENSLFLKKHGLGQLVFDRSDQESVRRSIEFAIDEYRMIKSKLLEIRHEYEWVNTMDVRKVEKVYVV